MVMIKRIIAHKDRGRIITNMFSLVFLQGANYILPLLTLPYLVRTLGIDLFGILAFIAAIMVYFTIVTDFGFNLTATKEIASCREKKEKVIEVYSAVMTIKLALSLVSLLFLFILIFTFESVYEHRSIYIISFFGVVAQAFFPSWIFQGLEKMKYITYVNVTTKVLFTLSIFIFVNSKADFFLVPLLTSLGLILSTIFSLLLVRKRFRITYRLVSFDILKRYISLSKKIFVGQVSYSMINPSIIFLLGTVAGSSAVGLFSIVEKLIRPIAGLASPISQTFFPYLSNAKTNGNMNTKEIAFIVTCIYSIISLSLGVLIYIFAMDILLLFYSEDNVNRTVINILKTLAFYPFLYGIVHVYCTQTLLIGGSYGAYKTILVTSLILNFVIGWGVLTYIGVIGAPILMMLTELYIVVCCVFFFTFRNKEVA